MLTHRDIACFCVVSHTPTQLDGVPALPQFCGSFLVMPTPFGINLPNLTWLGLHMWGRVCNLWSPTSPIPREQSSRASQFWGLGVVLYLCIHHLTQNDQIRHGNTYGDGHVSGQPRLFIYRNPLRRCAVCQRQRSFLFVSHYESYRRVTIPE